MKESDHIINPNRQLPAITATREQMDSVRQISVNGWVKSASEIVRVARGELSVSVEDLADAKSKLAQTPSDPEKPGRLPYEQRHAHATIEVFSHLPMTKQGNILHDGERIVFSTNGFIIQ